MNDKSDSSAYSKYYMYLQADHPSQIFQASSSLVTLLKYIYTSIHVSNILVLSACSKLPWIVSPLQLSLPLPSKYFIYQWLPKNIKNKAHETRFHLYFRWVGNLDSQFWLREFEITELRTIYGFKNGEATAGHRKLHLLYKTWFGNMSEMMDWLCQGGHCTGVTTFPPSCAYYLKILGASSSWSPWGLSKPVQKQLYLF